MRDIDTYKLCAKVTLFNLECERHGDEPRLLEFFYGVAQKEDVSTVFNISQWRIQRGEEGTFAPPKKKERERERGGRSSIPLISISTFIHSPVKCNKSLNIF
jgi:hypothetical protein